MARRGSKKLSGKHRPGHSVRIASSKHNGTMKVRKGLMTPMVSNGAGFGSMKGY
jgi:hypothetical protein